jgi:16S rRNA A1518/A1519 N6-dimethyltransferase RsmA/KsgA/DIM1 with predicted DNA glycosylase/AP lyase activity
VEYLFTVDENVSTKVKSGVMRMRRKDYSLPCGEKYCSKTAFQQRRKTLRNSLKH